MQKQILYPNLLPRIFSSIFDMIALEICFMPFQHYFQPVNIWFVNKYLMDGPTITHQDAASILEVWQNVTTILSFTLVLKIFLYCAILALPLLLLAGIYFVSCWSYSGTTIGKYLTRMRVVNFHTYHKLTPYQALVRFLGYFIAPVSLWSMLFDKKHRGIHDKLANSVVVIR